LFLLGSTLAYARYHAYLEAKDHKCNNNNRNSKLKIKNVERDKTNIVELPKLQVENFELVSKFEKLEL
jgi:hypothetical protein